MENLDMAVRLAVASSLAYEDRKTINKNLRSIGVTQITHISQNDTECFVGSDRWTVILAFRGTEIDSLQDWRTDIRLAKAAHPFGRVQTGFKRAYSHVEGEIVQAIAAMRRWPSSDDKSKQKSFWITGHSLGGALAVLAAAHLAPRLQYVDRICTFGQPRVGNRAFCRELDKILAGRYQRWVNNNDLVPRLPSSLHGYRHAGQLRYFNSHGFLHDRMTWRELARDRLRGAIADFGKPGLDAFKDHAIGGYVSLIDRHATMERNAIALGRAHDEQILAEMDKDQGGSIG